MVYSKYYEYDYGLATAKWPKAHMAAIFSFN